MIVSARAEGILLELQSGDAAVKEAVVIGDDGDEEGDGRRRIRKRKRRRRVGRRSFMWRLFWILWQLIFLRKDEIFGFMGD